MYMYKCAIVPTFAMCSITKHCERRLFSNKLTSFKSQNYPFCFSDPKQPSGKAHYNGSTGITNVTWDPLLKSVCIAYQILILTF